MKLLLFSLWTIFYTKHYQSLVKIVGVPHFILLKDFFVASGVLCYFSMFVSELLFITKRKV